MWASVNADTADVAGILFNPNDVVLVSPKRLSWAEVYWRALGTLAANRWIIDSEFIVLQNSYP